MKILLQVDSALVKVAMCTVDADVLSNLTTFESPTAKSCPEIQFAPAAPSRLLTNGHYGELLRLGDSRICAKV